MFSSSHSVFLPLSPYHSYRVFAPVRNSSLYSFSLRFHERIWLVVLFGNSNKFDAGARPPIRFVISLTRFLIAWQKGRLKKYCYYACTKETFHSPSITAIAIPRNQFTLTVCSLFFLPFLLKKKKWIFASNQPPAYPGSQLHFQRRMICHDPVRSSKRRDWSFVGIRWNLRDPRLAMIPRWLLGFVGCSLKGSPFFPVHEWHFPFSIATNESARTRNTMKSHAQIK